MNATARLFDAHYTDEWLDDALEAAITAARRIPVTDATVNRRAKALAELEELEAELRRAGK